MMATPQHLAHVAEKARESIHDDLADVQGWTYEMQHLCELKTSTEVEAILSDEGGKVAQLVQSLESLAHEAIERTKQICASLEKLPDASDEA